MDGSVNSSDQSSYIIIPVSNQSFDNVHIPIKSLPTMNILQLYDVLKAEVAPLGIWLKIAVEYYKQDCKETFREIVREILRCLRDPMESFYDDNSDETKIETIKLLNALASDYVKQAGSCEDPKLKAVLLADALDCLAGADRIDPMSELTWVGKGIFYLNQGELDRARYFFENAKKSRRNLAAMLGEACILFQEGSYAAALEMYCEVIQLNPNCDPSVRVGLGLCCYKLGQLDRAKLAMKRALELDPRNANALVSLAILELNESDLGSEKSPMHMENAIRMISKAYLLDKDNCMALNYLADHYFWTWINVNTTVSVIHGGTVVVCKDDVGSRVDSMRDGISMNSSYFHSGDYIRIGGGPPIQIDPLRACDGVRIYLAQPYEGDTLEGLSIQYKNYEKVMMLAGRSKVLSKVPEMKAEACYIMARVEHIRADQPTHMQSHHLKEAKQLYSQAATLTPDFLPAQFGLAKMHIIDGQFDLAIACLDVILEKDPDDRDSLKLLGYLYRRKNDTKMAILKFKHAVERYPNMWEAWLALGQIYLDGHFDPTQAISSFLHVLEIESKDCWESFELIDSGVLQTVHTNVGALYEHFGKYGEAMAAYGKALEICSVSEDENVLEQSKVSLVKSVDFANVFFWRWKEMNGTAKVSLGSSMVNVSESVRGMLLAGDHIRIGDDYAAIVEEVKSDTEVELTSRFLISSMGEFIEGQLYKKVLRIQLTPSSVSLIFNVALLQEKMGCTDAAIELHKAILAEHPTYSNSYLRLGSLAKNAGNTIEANRWFKQVTDVAKDDPDVLTFIGNLRMASEEWGAAQKNFERVLTMPESRGDSYSMVSLGNLYFSNLDDPGKYDKHLNHAANFYEQVLNQDPTNIYAASGIGMILAEKGALTKAKDVFTRLRDASKDDNVDIAINLAHVYLAQNKYDEAIRLYESCMNKEFKGKYGTLEMYLASAYFQCDRLRNCIHVLAKAVHSYPGDIKLWFNFALARETYAVTLLKKDEGNDNRSVVDVRTSITHFRGASAIFGSLADRVAENEKILPISIDRLKEHMVFCKSNILAGDTFLHLDAEKKRELNAQKYRRTDDEIRALVKNFSPTRADKDEISEEEARAPRIANLHDMGLDSDDSDNEIHESPPSSPHPDPLLDKSSSTLMYQDGKIEPSGFVSDHSESSDTGSKRRRPIVEEENNEDSPKRHKIASDLST